MSRPRNHRSRSEKREAIRQKRLVQLARQQKRITQPLKRATGPRFQRQQKPKAIPPMPSAERSEELNRQRILHPKHPSSGDRPFISDFVDGRQAIAYVRRSPVRHAIDQILRNHPGPETPLRTEVLLAVMYLAAGLGSFTRSAIASVLAGLDARIAIEWGLLDPDKGHQPLSYKTVHKHALILEQLLRTGATLENGTVIDLQWSTYEFLLPSVPKHLRRRVKEIAIDGTAIETYARVFDFTPQKQIKAGRIPKSSIIGPDNKPIRSLDFEATTGYRTKSSRHEAGPYNGYMLHTVHRHPHYQPLRETSPRQSRRPAPNTSSLSKSPQPTPTPDQSDTTSSNKQHGTYPNSLLSKPTPDTHEKQPIHPAPTNIRIRTDNETRQNRHRNHPHRRRRQTQHRPPRTLRHLLPYLASRRLLHPTTTPERRQATRLVHQTGQMAVLGHTTPTRRCQKVHLPPMCRTCHDHRPHPATPNGPTPSSPPSQHQTPNTAATA